MSYWLHSLMFINEQRGPLDFGPALLSSPSFWMLTILTASIALPPTLPVPVNLYAQAIAGSAFTNLETMHAD